MSGRYPDPQYWLNVRTYTVEDNGKTKRQKDWRQSFFVTISIVSSNQWWRLLRIQQ